MRMANNLNSMIAKSGLSKKDVGAAVGHTPETVSRHISGNIKMTLDHAESYARVLNCSPYDVMFEAQPMPIIGKCSIDAEGKIGRLYSKASFGKVYSHTYRPDETGIVHWTVAKQYTGPWNYWTKALEALLLDPIKNNYVHDEAVGNECYAYLEEPIVGQQGFETNLVAGVLYPQPGGLYTMHNGDLNMTCKDQKLVWATPVLSMIIRPDLRGLKIILDK
tara:strand:- start:106 stop:765 length:660 start_codon:yes stop_codon:yes gene_type:complete